MASYLDKKNFDKMAPRPAYKSDFNFTNYATRSQARVLLGLLAIRELPIKSFYVRAWLSYFWCIYFVARGLGRGWTGTRPLVLYAHPFNMKPLINMPDLFYWNLTRILPRYPIVTDTNKEWRMRQTPVFHQYHRCVYRYRFRKPRYIQWDGTQSQPVMPYLNDTGTEVINGTFKRNPNSVPQLH